MLHTLMKKIENTKGFQDTRPSKMILIYFLNSKSSYIPCKQLFQIEFILEESVKFYKYINHTPIG